MTAASLLVPDFALQLPLRMRTHDRLALRAQGLRLLQHPRVSKGMFARANGAVPNIFREVLRVRKDLCLG